MDNKMQEKVVKFRKIVNEMADLYEKKNSNYGDSFGKLCKDLGPIAGLVPLHNKLDRLTNLIKGGTNNFESVEDTLKDLACYAIMNLIELEGQKPCKPSILNPGLEDYIGIRGQHPVIEYKSRPLPTENHLPDDYQWPSGSTNDLKIPKGLPDDLQWFDNDLITTVPIPNKGPKVTN